MCPDRTVTDVSGCTEAAGLGWVGGAGDGHRHLTLVSRSLRPPPSRQRARASAADLPLKGGGAERGACRSAQAAAYLPASARWLIQGGRIILPSASSFGQTMTRLPFSCHCT